jgi:uroporphyrinogen decarboxylase
MSVLHICGDTNHLIAEMEKAGSDGLSLDKQVDFPSAYDALQGDTVLIGNIDPVSVMAFDDADSVKRKSKGLLDAMGERKNFILSTGCDVPPNAPIANIRAMMEASE